MSFILPAMLKPAEADLRGIELPCHRRGAAGCRPPAPQRAIKLPATVMPRTGATSSPSRHGSRRRPAKSPLTTTSAPGAGRPAIAQGTRRLHPRPRRGGRARTPGDAGSRQGAAAGEAATVARHAEKWRAVALLCSGLDSPSPMSSRSEGGGPSPSNALIFMPPAHMGPGSPG